MTIHFFIKYKTQFGERLFMTGNHELLGSNQKENAVALQYFNEEFWQASIEVPEESEDVVYYQYFVKDKEGVEIFDGERDRYIQLAGLKDTTLNVIDTWNVTGDIKNVFFTEAYSKVLLPPLSSVTPPSIGDYTHEFRVKSTLLKPGQTIVMYGSTPGLKQWNKEDPIFLEPKNNWFIARIHLAENEWPATYKYGIYDLNEKKLLSFEEGENRVLYKKRIGISIFQDGFIHYASPLWKGAGVTIPVFSLRSNKGFGVGEFEDIKLLIDWALKADLQLIQLLPINDTIAHKNWSDSYPYSAISAFALHPLYINLDEVAGKEFESVLKPLRKKQRELNKLSAVDYEQVIKIKLSVLKELFEKQYEAFINDKEYIKFFELNRSWLVPYAAFCYLRDKYNTPDFSNWKTYSSYQEAAIQKLVSPRQKHYSSILFYYYIQYNLHLQLKQVADYALQKKVALKGDLPIGIYRYSCDAWVNPTLYNMDEQSGAPPDDFAVKGQNWGFPTYNWDKMKKDNFDWWRRRFEQMNVYFDAFRIDHILGFFRMWSIPLDAVEGILGRFVPAIPVHVSEFDSNQLTFNYERFCTPYITNEFLDELFKDRKDEVRLKFLIAVGDNQYCLKDLADTQRKIADLLPEGKDDLLRQGLFDLVSNVIMLEEKGSDKTKFHFRVAMGDTNSFNNLNEHTKYHLKELYVNYFYRRQDDFWRKKGLEKLPALKRTTNMLIFGEDLGMVPHCVPEVLRQLGILSLEIERMPKKAGIEFFHPKDAPYLSVVTPSTHDMSTIRGWWSENRERTQKFYNYMLGHYGEAPVTCEAWINKEIILQHVYSPAIWCIFLIQDLFGIDDTIRRENPSEERINLPSDPDNHWKYRMHINLEDLLNEKEFNAKVRKLMTDSGRAAIV